MLPLNLMHMSSYDVGPRHHLTECGARAQPHAKAECGARAQPHAKAEYGAAVYQTSVSRKDSEQHLQTFQTLQKKMAETPGVFRAKIHPIFAGLETGLEEMSCMALSSMLSLAAERHP